MKRIALAAALACAAAPPARAALYTVDSSYSAARMSIRHWFFFHPQAQFSKVSGTLDYTAGRPELWKVSVKIQTESLNAWDKKRTRLLLSPSYLDAKSYPEIRFESTRVYAGKDGRTKMDGELTVKGRTRSVTFDVTPDFPLEPDLSGVMGLSGRAVVDRRWWRVPSGLFFGHEVQLTVLLQGVPQS